MENPVTVPEIIKIAAEAGAKAALEAMEREKKNALKNRKDRRLRNTKLLLRNYRMFRQHIEESICSESQLYEYENVVAKAIDILYDLGEQDNDDLYIESIRRSQTRTQIIMQHIDHMISLYKTYCQNSGNNEDRRRYAVIYAMYIESVPWRIEEIATEKHINSRTVYKDIDAACETLSALIFGIDGLQTGG